jgi:hypothetical protein
LKAWNWIESAIRWLIISQFVCRLFFIIRFGLCLQSFNCFIIIINLRKFPLGMWFLCITYKISSNPTYVCWLTFKNRASYI